MRLIKRMISNCCECGYWDAGHIGKADSKCKIKKKWTPSEGIPDWCIWEFVGFLDEEAAL